MQFRRRPWLTLIGCVAASAGLAQQVPHPQAQQTGSPAAGDPAPLPKAADPTGFGLKLRGAPISASGSLSYDLRINHAQGEARTLQHLVTANMSAATYLYQPWFAIEIATASAWSKASTNARTLWASNSSLPWHQHDQKSQPAASLRGCFLRE